MNLVRSQSNLKFLILLLYYERPILVRNALNSVLRNNYHDWHVAFIDDSSPTPGRPIAEEIFRSCLDKISFYNTEVSVSEKLENGSIVGKLMNEAIQNSNADICLMLCDDDELCKDYLAGLDSFFRTHLTAPATYSHIHLYNPGFEDSFFVDNVAPRIYNRYRSKINPAGKADASQVAWRSLVNKIDNIWFPFPQTRNLDESFYKNIFKIYGKIPFSQLIGQYKSDNVVQLRTMNEKEIWSGRSIDKNELEQMTPVADIIEIIRRYRGQFKFDQAQSIKNKALSIHPDNSVLSNEPASRLDPFNKCPYRSPMAISDALSHIIRGKTVYELGCAEGDNLAFMSRYASYVYGMELDRDKAMIGRGRGFEVHIGDYRESSFPKADIYYFWPTEAHKDDEFLVKKILSMEGFDGTIIVAGDTGYPPEIPYVVKCAKLGRLVEVKFNEGTGYRQNGKFLLAIIDADSCWKIRN